MHRGILSRRHAAAAQCALWRVLGADTPHSWASAECVRFLRHMLVLEDNQSLRLLEGITAAEFT